MQSIIKVFTDFALETGFAAFFTQPGAWKYAVMIVVACFLLYLAIVKKFEPLLLLPIAFGMLLTNLPGAGLYNADIFSGGQSTTSISESSSAFTRRSSSSASVQ